MVRPLAIPAAFAVIVGLPAIVGQSQPSPPQPREAALTVAFDGGGTKQLAIVATGSPPVSAVLRSDDGTETANAVTIPSCAHTELRNAGVSKGTTWCIELQGLPGHGTVSGKLDGTGGTPTTVTLTVNTRDPLKWRPFAFLVIGLLACLLATPVTALLARLVRRNNLALLLQRNRTADAPDQITGLDDYVAARKAAGDDDATIVGQIAPVITEGPSQARAARSSLRAAIDASPLGATSAYERAARAEAAATDNKVTDFLKPDGTQATHPAVDLEAGITSMDDYRNRLGTFEHEISTALVLGCQTTPMQKLGVARLRWERVASRAEIADLGEPFQQVRDEIDAKLSTNNCRKPNVSGASAGYMAIVAAVASPAAPAPTGLSAGSLIGRTIALGVATLLTILLVLVFTFETVRLGAYESTATFGSFADYFTLFSTALAAGAAATVAALLAPWSLAPPGKASS